MKILTGVGENPHVTSKDFRRIIENIAGQGSYIIGCGENMTTELVSNNLLKIRDGAMIHHGNVSTVDTYDEIEISNGTQGMKRIDLVVNRYTKNAKTQIETNEWVVLQGVPAETNPTVPEYVVGNLQEGDLVDDCPFCQIVIDGINVTEVKELLGIIPSVPELQQGLAELNSNFDKILTYKPKLLAGTTNSGREINWTPVYNVGNYVKLGRLVFLSIAIRGTIAESGEIAMISLPISPSSDIGAVALTVGTCVSMLDTDYGNAEAYVDALKKVIILSNINGSNAYWNTCDSGYLKISGWYICN